MHRDVRLSHHRICLFLVSRGQAREWNRNKKLCSCPYLQSHSTIVYDNMPTRKSQVKSCLFGFIKSYHLVPQRATSERKLAQRVERFPELENWDFRARCGGGFVVAPVSMKARLSASRSVRTIIRMPPGRSRVPRDENPIILWRAVPAEKNPLGSEILQNRSASAI